MGKNFENRLREWGEKVIKECAEIATNPNYEMNYMFYPLQSGVKFQPKILFIGTNPGSKHEYREETLEGDILRTKQNEFLANYDNPEWRNYRAFTDIFCGDILRPVYENAIFINMFYFNSGTFNAIKEYKGYKEALAICQKLTLEFIDLVQPQSIITLGNPARDWFVKLTKERKIEVAATAENGNRLIGKATYNDIPVFSICHPTTASRETRLYNTGENQKRKHEFFKEFYRK